jgi:hypothetical protein
VENRDSSPQRVRVALFAVRSPLSGPSLDAAVVALTAGRGAPFRGASGLPAGTVWLAGDAAAVAAADLARAADRAHLLATADAFPAPDLSASARPDEVRLPCIDLQVGADGGIHVRVGAERTADGSPVLAAHLAAPLPAEGPVVLFVPAGNAPVAGHAFVLARMAADASTAAAAAQARASAASPAPPQIGWPRRWRIAFQSVGQHNRRPPLLEIARTLGASRCRDALLVADEALLIAFTERLAVELTPADAYAPWPFERVLWRALLPRLERDELPDALHAHCLRQLGAMADDTAALRCALDASADGEAFYGYGDDIATTDGTLKGLICNWAGPGGTRRLETSYAQRQFVAFDAARPSSSQRFCAGPSSVLRGSCAASLSGCLPSPLGWSLRCWRVSSTKKRARSPHCASR